MYSTPQKRFSLQAKQKESAFTLIELIMVMAVIGILVAITFGIISGVRTAQARSLAKVELGVIAQALEQYKARYGDYPRHDSTDADYPSTSGEVTSTMLLYALTGRMKMEAQPGQNMLVYKVSDSLDNSLVQKAPKFIDLSKFNYSGSDDEPEALLDPWGNPYVYWYKWENTPADWDVFGFHLYSTGPNGPSANDAIKDKINHSTGVLDKDFREIADAQGIIFSSE